MWPYIPIKRDLYTPIKCSPLAISTKEGDH